MNTLRVKAVAQKLGIGVSTVWKLTNVDKAFPKPFKLAPNLNVTVWDEDEIDLYLTTRKHSEVHHEHAG